MGSLHPYLFGKHTDVFLNDNWLTLKPVIWDFRKSSLLSQKNILNSHPENSRFTHKELFLGCKMLISQTCVLFVLLLRMRKIGKLNEQVNL